ncbi:DNA-3-methyladenine glycosylase family protein [Frondihabitans cladoniiphilus]|uniref:DNA-3-methyladenine glycosylase n=1 Tax=Frondihabitans cladoniiphilus TaxID=715785 RepID=A0ABP8VJ47_9MICO
MTTETTPPTLESVHWVEGPWSLATSRRFWEGFSPSALAVSEVSDEIRAVFLSDTDWHRVEATIVQEGDSARIRVTGAGDLTAATSQVRRFLSIDIDGRGWRDVADRDPVIADAQRRLPGFRPCGFYSPYEAAAWSVLSQRIQMRQAAAIKQRLTDEHGEGGAFPAPAVIRGLELDLPGRKNEYLHAVAEAALDGVLSGERLRGLAPETALDEVQGVLGLGPFAAELVVIRGANSPDVLPRNEKRLTAEIEEQYGVARSVAEITDQWRPYRSWAAVHLRALREERTGEIERSRPVRSR